VKANGRPDDEDMDRRIILPNHVIQDLKKLGATEVETGDKYIPEGNGKPHLSFSQLAMYLRCPKQYDFKYNMHAPDKPKVSLALGKGGHAALEKNVKRKLKSGFDSPTEEVVQWASDFMDHELRALPPSEVEQDVKAGDTKDRFIAATKVFQTRDAPGIKPIGAEVSFQLDMNEYLPEPLQDPLRVVIGKIDLLYDDMGKRVVQENGLVRVAVEDYKFVTRKRSQNEVDISPQLSLYGTVVKKLTGKWPTRIGYRMLTPGNTKEGPDATLLERSPELMKATVLESRMRRLAYQFEMVERGVRAGVFPPTDDPISCSWCPFRERCQDTLVDDFQAAKIRQETTPR
jgi:PD-(D/E)XK nuclease superfamily protein